MSSSVQLGQLALISLSGFLFWFVAARRFSPSTVGEASTLATLTLFISYATSLGLPITVARFANTTSLAATRVFAAAVAATTAATAAGALGVGLFVGEDVVGPLFAHGRPMGVLVLFLAVNGLSIFTLLDLRHLALGRSRAVLARSAVAATLRLAIGVLPIPDEAFWVWLWVAASIPIAILVVWPVTRGRSTTTALVADEPALDAAGIVRFSAVNYLGLLLSQAPVVIFPFIVVTMVPATEAAVFFVAWSMASSALLIPTITARALLIEGHAADRELRAQSWFVVRATAALAVVTLIAAVPVAILMPRMYGDAYADSGLLLLVLLLSLLPYSVTAISLTFTRIRHRDAHNVATSGVLAAGILVPALLVAPDAGALGASVVWLVGHVAAAVTSLWGITPEARDQPRGRVRQPASRRMVIASLAVLILGYLVAGVPGVLVSGLVVATQQGGAAGIALPMAALLMVAAAIATIVESDLAVSLDFARQRPTASAFAMFAVLIAASAGLVRLAAAGPPPAKRDPRASVPARRQRIHLAPSLAALTGGAVVAAVIGPSALSPGQRSALQDLFDLGFSRVAANGGPSLAAAPLGPLLAAFGPVDARVLQIALFAVAGVLAAGLMTRCSHFRLLAGPGACLPALLVRPSLSATLALALVLAAMTLADHGHWGLGGIVLGFGVLAAPEVLVLAAVGVVAWRVRRGKSSLGQRIWVSGLGTAAVLVPWLSWLTDRVTIPDLARALDARVLLALAVSLIAIVVIGAPEWSAAAQPARWRRVLHHRSPEVRVLGVLGCAALLVTLSSGAGQYVADFRFDAVWSPGMVLERLGSVWSSTGGLGRIAGSDSNPLVLVIFGSLRALGVSPGVAQQLWHAGLLFLAGSGVVLVVRFFRPTTGWPHLVAALAYMFSPLSLSLLTTSAIHLAAFVIVPWLQACVLFGLTRPRDWRWPALATLLLLAAMPTELPAIVYDLALLVPAACYVVLVEGSARWRDAGRFGARLALLSACTLAFVAVRSVYGRGDLASRVALSETPDLVNAASSYSESVRGMGIWLTYFRFGALTTRPHHAVLVDSPIVVMATFVVPVVALAYLARRPRWLPGAFFAVLAALSLMVMVGIHPAVDPSPWGQLVELAYDHLPGATALRNTAKAGAPMVLALCVLFGVAVAGARRALTSRRAGNLLLGGIALTLMAASLPAWTGDLYNRDQQLDSIPGYWQESFDWLNDPARGEGQILVLPGSYATTYRWGYVGDDIMDAFLRHPHLRPSPFPQSTPQAENLTAAVDAAAAQGRLSSDELVTLLRRLGVRYLLLRNDLDWQAMGRPRPYALEALRHTSELELAASFGQPGQNTTVEADRSPAATRERELPPVEVYELHDALDPTRAEAARTPLLVDGDADAWWHLASLGTLDGGPPIAYVSSLTDRELVAALRAGANVYVSDSNVRRERAASRGGTRVSSALPAAASTGGALPGTRPDEQTTSVNADGATVTSSSPRVSQPWYRAEHAFDDDPRTAWRTTELGNPLGAWIRVDFARPTAISEIVAHPSLVPGGRSIRTARVTTSDGQVAGLDVVGPQAVAVLDGAPIDWLSVEITGLTGRGGNAVGFTDIDLPGMDLAEMRQLPRFLFARAKAEPSLERALGRAAITYLFEREVGPGPRPVEQVLRRRFEVGTDTTFELRGTLSLDRDAPPADVGTCGATSVTIDGEGVPVSVTPLLDNPGSYAFVACAELPMEAGPHTLSHPPETTVERAELRPTGGVPEPTPTRAVGVDVIEGTATRHVYDLRTRSPHSYLMTGVAYHDGWQATDGTGEHLDVIQLDTQAAVVVDGVGSHRVEMRFGPQRAYGLSILLMLAGAAVCVWLVMRPQHQARTANEQPASA